jgi:hypothetical protein
MSGMTASMSVRSGKASYDTTVYTCLHMCIGAYLIVDSKFNHRVALVQKYIYWDIYESI